ncbi:MAG TPA: SDR family NAD(P)-dependent oxidoreductase, partial [Pseudonocardiaceae bacterium]|nr:SDR family NAD(P)-dependent oxidoreductase [Pseudonocardiaceae bacterium]
MGTLRRTALVLGASGELGGEIVRRLIGLCSMVFVHGPDADALSALCAELAGIDERCQVVGVPADFASLDGTRELIRTCARTTSEVDFVVNAVDLLPPRTRSVTDDGNELTWQVNYLGPALV